nr:KD-rich 15kDa protein [Limnephilus flavicornis]
MLGKLLFVLVTFLYLVQSHPFGNGEFEIEGKKFYPVVRMLGPDYKNDHTALDKHIFLKADFNKDTKTRCRNGDNFQDEKSILGLATKTHKDEGTIGTQGKKLVFKGIVPVDWKSLIDNARNTADKPVFDTTGKTLVYRGIVPIKMIGLKNKLK